MTTESSNNVKKIILFHKALKIQRLKRKYSSIHCFKRKNIFKDEDKDSEKSKSSSEDKSDDTQKLRIIQKHITSHIREMTKVKSSSLH